MECKKCVGFLVLVAMVVFLVVSLATKSAHWEKALQVDNESLMFDELQQVYRSLEGLLAVDVLLLLVVGFLTAVFLVLRWKLCTNALNVLKILLVLWVLLVCTRFVLGILFLAGENGYCHRQLRYYWDELPQNMKDYLENENFFTTLESAWVFEIVFNVLFYVMATILLALLWKESREHEGKYNEYTI